jgi:hypothetical protein
MNKFLLILVFFCNSVLCMETKLVPYMDTIRCLETNEGLLEESIVKSTVKHNPLVTGPACLFTCKRWFAFLNTQETHILVLRARNFNANLLKKLNSCFYTNDNLIEEVDTLLLCPTFRLHACGNYISATIEGTRFGNSPARKYFLQKIVQNHPLSFTKKEKKALCDALCSESTDYFFILAKAGVDFNNTNLLHKAVRKENVDLIKNLLALGYNVEKRDQQGQTPLALAMLRICAPLDRHACMDMIGFLLQAGADQNSGLGLPDPSETCPPTVRTLFEWRSAVGLENSEQLRALFDHYQKALVVHNPPAGGEHRNE